MRFLRPCVVLGFICLAVPGASAAAARHIAPPGNSGVSQYLETVPGAGGNATPGKAGGSVLPRTTRRELDARGADGAQLESAVDAAAVPAPDKRSAHPVAPSPEIAGDRRSPLASATDALLGQSGDGGTGMLLPAVLIASTILLVLAAVLRRRQA